MSGTSRAARWALPAGALAVACAIPPFLGDLTFFVQTALAALVVVGLSLFMGYAGQTSLGQGAFVAVGGLTVAVLTTRAGLPPALALVLAPVAAGLVAALVGWPLLRLRGHYLAFGTLAVLLIIQTVMATVPLFGGGIGIFGIPPLSIGPVTVQGQLPYAYLAIAAVAVAMVVSRNLVASRFGRGMRALAGSESAAGASGVPVARTKVAVFVVAGAFAGLAGGIGAFFTPYVSQDTFPPLASFGYVIMAVVGGLGSLWGGVVGAVAVGVWLQLLSAVATAPGLPPAAAPALQYAGYGLLLVVFLLLVPRGIVPPTPTPTALSVHDARMRRPRRPRVVDTRGGEGGVTDE